MPISKMYMYSSNIKIVLESKTFLRLQIEVYSSNIKIVLASKIYLRLQIEGNEKVVDKNMVIDLNVDLNILS